MDTSSRQWIVRAAVLAALITCGCNQAQMTEMQNWFDQQNQKKSKPPANTTQTVKASPVQRSAENQHPTPPDQDAQSQEVDQKVDRYVQSMDTSDAKYSASHEGSDSKTQAQDVPKERIEQTAARDDIDSSNEPKSNSDPKSVNAVSESREPAVIPPPQTEPTPLPVTKVEEIKADPVDGKVAVSDDSTTEEPIVETAKSEPKQVAVHTPAKPATASNDLPPNWSYDKFNEKFDANQEQAKKTKPPVVENIKVEAAPEQKDDTPVTTASPAARANTPPTTPTSDNKSRIAEQEAKVAKDPNNVDEQFKLRLMYLSDNQDEKALASTPGINADILDIMRAQIQSLMTARSSAQRDPSLWANRQLEAIENLRALVRARADIKVSKVAICRSITSFGVYEPIDPPNFKIGQRNAMFLYVPIENYKTQRTKSGMYRTLLSIRYSVIDSNGKELWSDKIENIEDLAREHRQDFYLGVGPEGGFVLPSRWGPGEYTIKVEVEDMLAQKINSNTTKFTIVS